MQRSVLVRSRPDGREDETSLRQARGTESLTLRPSFHLFASSSADDMATYHESLFLQAEQLQRQFLDNRRNAKPQPTPAVKESGVSSGVSCDAREA
jgi:hypothetical protein